MKKGTWIRNSFFVLAAVSFVWHVLGTIRHAQYMWENEFKVYNFDSFAEYFFSAHDMSLLVWLGVAVAIAVAGIIIQDWVNLERNARTKRKREEEAHCRE